LDLGECVAEPARLNRSTWRVGLGEKEQDHVFAAKILQRDCLSLFISQRELRGFIINFHGFSVFIRSMNLYSRTRFLASAVLVLACAAVVVPAMAQRRKPHKLRATAVVEVTTDSAGVVGTRVFPVTVLDEGGFHDAGIYKATPQPMALDNGIVYEAQADGIPVGYATIVSSTNNKGWTALGKWQLADAAKKSQAPAAVTAGNDRPVIRRDGGSSSGSPAASGSDDRPVLHRGDSSPTPGDSGNQTPSSPAQPAADTSSANAPSNDSASAPDDSDRPVLRRRSPQKQDTTSTPPPLPTPAPGTSDTSRSATPTPSPQTAPAASHTKLPVVLSGTRTFVAVSDNEPVDIRSYDFKWKPGEDDGMELKMRKLALAQLPRENAQLNTNSLQNVVMRSFDLDLSNDAVIVFSAEIPGSYLAPGAKDSPGKFISRYVTVIARMDFDGMPQKLASSVTDSSRLDVAPRLELIDAVDVDGDGLAELLFRQYSYDEKSFIVYGVGRSTVTKVFVGASMPLR
jgi:hypothetical protein